MHDDELFKIFKLMQVVKTGCWLFHAHKTKHNWEMRFRILRISIQAWDLKFIRKNLLIMGM